MNQEHGQYSGVVDIARNGIDEVIRLKGENAALLGLLTDCTAVIRTIEPECSDEADKLRALLHAIYRAQEPSRHKGALL